MEYTPEHTAEDEQEADVFSASDEPIEPGPFSSEDDSAWESVPERQLVTFEMVATDKALWLSQLALQRGHIKAIDAYVYRRVHGLEGEPRLSVADIHDEGNLATSREVLEHGFDLTTKVLYGEPEFADGSMPPAPTPRPEREAYDDVHHMLLEGKLNPIEAYLHRHVAAHGMEPEVFERLGGQFNEDPDGLRAILLASKDRLAAAPEPTVPEYEPGLYAYSWVRERLHMNEKTIARLSESLGLETVMAPVENMGPKTGRHLEATDVSKLHVHMLETTPPLRETDHSIVSIAATLGRDHTEVRAFLTRYGLAGYSRYNQHRKPTECFGEATTEWVMATLGEKIPPQGMSLKEVGARLGADPDTVGSLIADSPVAPFVRTGRPPADKGTFPEQHPVRPWISASTYDQFKSWLDTRPEIEVKKGSVTSTIERAARGIDLETWLHDPQFAITTDRALRTIGQRQAQVVRLHDGPEALTPHEIAERLSITVKNARVTLRAGRETLHEVLPAIAAGSHGYAGWDGTRHAGHPITALGLMAETGMTIGGNLEWPDLLRSAREQLAALPGMDDKQKAYLARYYDLHDSGVAHTRTTAKELGIAERTLRENVERTLRQAKPAYTKASFEGYEPTVDMRHLRRMGFFPIRESGFRPGLSSHKELATGQSDYELYQERDETSRREIAALIGRITGSVNEEWREEAACQDVEDPDIFTPVFEADTRSIQEAKRICMSCVVRLECLQSESGQADAHSIIGGFTAAERRTMRANASI